MINYEKNLLNQEDNHGETVLDYFIHYQKEEDSVEGLKFLIEAGADVNHKDRFGDKPIAKAFSFNHMKDIEILLDAGTIIDENDFMRLKNTISISCNEPYIKIKLLKRLYEIVGKKF